MFYALDRWLRGMQKRTNSSKLLHAFQNFPKGVEFTAEMYIVILKCLNIITRLDNIKCYKKKTGKEKYDV